MSTVYRDTCGKCGAVRIDRQIGLEATPDAYLATMVAVFREVRRVLRPDGTCWVNMGDSYASNGTSGLNDGFNERDTHGHARGPNARSMDDRRNKGIKRVPSGLKPKDLLLMPARLALALQADGWWVRSDIIIAKKNPMPESCRDRPTSAHEHVFLLTKSARYFYDIDGVREPIKDSSLARLTQPNVLNQPGGPKDSGEGNRSHRKTLRNQAEKLIAAEKWKDRFEGYEEWDKTQGRNIRNVWDISTEAFGGAHFATMPTSVVERCIRAGTSERGACSQCGAPWKRVTQTSGGILGKSWHDHSADATNGNAGVWVGQPTAEPYQRTTSGWYPTCWCYKAPIEPIERYIATGRVVPCTVLDPFAGAGTTLLVADRLQRDAIGIELNTAYTQMAMDRCVADAPLFTSFPPAEDPEESMMRDLFADAEYHEAPPRKVHVPSGWDTGPGAHGTIHRNGRNGIAEAAE